MKTTMNAELSHEEAMRVIRAWEVLVTLKWSKGYFPDIPEMLAYATEAIMAAHELRRQIADACHYAERRAFPAEHRPKGHKVAGPWDLAQKLHELGITEEDFAAALKQVKP